MTSLGGILATRDRLPRDDHGGGTVPRDSQSPCPPGPDSIDIFWETLLNTSLGGFLSCLLTFFMNLKTILTVFLLGNFLGDFLSLLSSGAETSARRRAPRCTRTLRRGNSGRGMSHCARRPTGRFSGRAQRPSPSCRREAPFLKTNTCIVFYLPQTDLQGKVMLFIQFLACCGAHARCTSIGQLPF